MKMFRSHLLLCGGTGCHATGSLSVKKALVSELMKKGLSEEIKLVETGCNGFCAMGPIMVVYPEGVIYMNIKMDDIPELVEEHLVKGRVLQRLPSMEVIRAVSSPQTKAPAPW
jgi:(2Fe-2S) ferredoxin